MTIGFFILANSQVNLRITISSAPGSTIDPSQLEIGYTHVLLYLILTGSSSQDVTSKPIVEIGLTECLKLAQ